LSLFFSTNSGNFSKIKRSRDESTFGDVLFAIFSKILNQGTNKYNLIAANTWVLIAVILANCFSNQLLSSLLYQQMEKIDSFDDLINTNLTFVTAEYSWLGTTITHPNNNKDEYDYKIESLKPKLRRGPKIEVISIKLSTISLFLFSPSNV